MNPTRPLLLCLALLAGCQSWKGIRTLDDREQIYFNDLKAQLKQTRGSFHDLLAQTRVNEEQALREVALLEAKQGAAKVIYATRELLVPPRGDKSDVAQATRSKAIVLQLVALAEAEETAVQARLAEGDAQRAAIDRQLQAILDAASGAVETSKVLHAWFNRNEVGSARAIADDVRRQIDAFDTVAAAAADQSPLLKQLSDKGAQASSVEAKANDALGKLIDLWSKLDTKGGK